MSNIQQTRQIKSRPARTLLATTLLAGAGMLNAFTFSSMAAVVGVGAVGASLLAGQVAAADKPVGNPIKPKNGLTREEAEKGIKDPAIKSCGICGATGKVKATEPASAVNASGSAVAKP